jgi:hypothetical protein
MSDSEDESRDKTLKIVIIGDGSSGKVLLNLKAHQLLLILFLYSLRPPYQHDTRKINSTDSIIKH